MEQAPNPETPSFVIVDDDELIRELMCSVAQETIPAAAITEFESCAQALRQIERGHVDLLITDCNMDGMDGPALVEAMRAQEIAIPVIMVSGCSDARRRGEAAGLVEHRHEGILARFAGPVPREALDGVVGDAVDLRLYLGAHEIVNQFLRLEELSGEKINNIVFMGMGEPLANFADVMRAIAIINAPWGIGLGARHITLSTSGLAPQIRQLADQPLQVRLAISLHGATDEVREQIMPVNRKYPLATLLEACAYYTSRKKQHLTFEYILIDGINDRPEDAAALVRVARKVKAKINCIPYNTVEGLPWHRPSEARQDAFMAVLDQAGIPATLRREKGHDIAAACGQLRRQTSFSEGAAGRS